MAALRTNSTTEDAAPSGERDHTSGPAVGSAWQILTTAH